jgi:hypothetical protein
MAVAAVHRISQGHPFFMAMAAVVKHLAALDGTRITPTQMPLKGV